MCTERIEREIESKDIHPRLTQETEVRTFGILADLFSDLLLGYASCSGNTSGLKFGILCADMGIQTAAGSGYGIGGEWHAGWDVVCVAVG